MSRKSRNSHQKCSIKKVFFKCTIMNNLTEWKIWRRMRNLTFFNLVHCEVLLSREFRFFLIQKFSHCLSLSMMSFLLKLLFCMSSIFVNLAPVFKWSSLQSRIYGRGPWARALPIFCNHLLFCNHFEELQTALFEV